jgi:immune inhibitor A
MKAKWFITFVIVAMLLAVIVPNAIAAPPTLVSDADDPSFASNSDDAAHPLGSAQRAARAVAMDAQLHGKISGATSSNTYKVALKHYVELNRTGEDKIWTLLTEFGNGQHPSYPGGLLGPLHNQIPQPNRIVDNTTIWTSDFNKPYYENLLFSGAPGAVSMRNFYIEQSSNRYTVNGVFEDWAVLPYNEARYGRNFCGSIVCSNTWRVMQDGTNVWYANQIALGKTPAEIDAYLAQFDVWDRYDYDGDGNFNEPDGYIDHFQAVHAGEGEETGGGAQGTDAIWSHRWYVQLTCIGCGGPTVGGSVNPLGGVRVGGSKYWIGDYTVEPENGGVGVFSHEFGHDLGLPDLYDTSGNTGGAENSTGFWTLYSQGSYGSTGNPIDGIGSKPIHMSAYEKIFLGWSNYQVVNFNQKANVKLGPAEYNTKWAQQLIVLLPNKQVSTFIGAPFAGTYFYHSGAGNDLDNKMSRSVTLPAGTVLLSAKARYDAELDFDYIFLTVNGVPVHTNLSSGTDPNGNNTSLQGITGSSNGLWVDLTADLSGFAGQTVTLGFEYKTDPAVAEAGFGVDDIAITGLPTDGAETDPGWTYAGFSRTTGTVVQSYANYYVAEYRQYAGFDYSLKSGPYNFGFPDTKPDWVEHFPYQDGLLVWYLDYSFPDNNVGDNCLNGRCGGFFLPVDAHPDLLMRPDNGKVWRPRVQSYDATFGMQATDKICLHTSSTVFQCYGPLKANPLFNDKVSYWRAPNPAIGNFGWASVPLPGFGVKLRVLDQSSQIGGTMSVLVNQ